MSRRAKKRKAPTVGSEIARMKNAEGIVAFLHGYLDGGAECYGLSQQQCAEMRDALALWLGADKWKKSSASSSPLEK